MPYSKVIGTLVGLMTLNAPECLQLELAESDEGAVKDCAIILLHSELPIYHRYDEEYLPRLLGRWFRDDLEVLLELAKSLHKGSIANYETIPILKKNLYELLYRKPEKPDYQGTKRIMCGELMNFIKDNQQEDILRAHAAKIVAAWGSIEQVCWTISLLKKVDKIFFKEEILQGLVFSSRRFPQLNEKINKVVINELETCGNMEISSRNADLTHACVTLLTVMQNSDLTFYSIDAGLPCFLLENSLLELAKSKNDNINFALINYCFIKGNISECHRKVLLIIYQNTDNTELKKAAVKALQNMISKGGSLLSGPYIPEIIEVIGCSIMKNRIF